MQKPSRVQITKMPIQPTYIAELFVAKDAKPPYSVCMPNGVVIAVTNSEMIVKKISPKLPSIPKTDSSVTALKSRKSPTPYVNPLIKADFINASY